MTYLDTCHFIHPVCVCMYLVFIYVYISSNIYVSAFVLHNITIIVIHLYSNNFAYSISFFWIVIRFYWILLCSFFFPFQGWVLPVYSSMFWLIQPLFFCCQLYNLTVKLRTMLLLIIGSILTSFKFNLSSWQIKCVKFIYSNNIYVFLPFVFNVPWKFLDFITSYFFIPCFFLVMTFTSSSCT